MKIVVIGGTGIMGEKLVRRLRAKGHEVIDASSASCVNTATGEGIPEILMGAQIVVDVANSPSFRDKAVLDFFRASGHSRMPPETAAGVKRRVALSVVGKEQLQESEYFCAKLDQERLSEDSPTPYALAHPTRPSEFMLGIAVSRSEGDQVNLSPDLMQAVIRPGTASPRRPDATQSRISESDPRQARDRCR